MQNNPDVCNWSRQHNRSFIVDHSHLLSISYILLSFLLFLALFSSLRTAQLPQATHFTPGKSYIYYSLSLSLSLSLHLYLFPRFPLCVLLSFYFASNLARFCHFEPISGCFLKNGLQVQQLSFNGFNAIKCEVPSILHFRCHVEVASLVSIVSANGQSFTDWRSRPLQTARKLE